MVGNIIEYIRVIFSSAVAFFTFIFIERLKNKNNELNSKLKKSEIEKNNLEAEIKQKDDILLEMDVKDKMDDKKQEILQQENKKVKEKDKKISDKLDSLKDGDESIFTI